jgi:C-terminal processing protease CtpA/Prc
MVGKDAMVIDVRFNGGGNIADTLIDWLERRPHGFVRPRDAAKETTPYHAWDKKIVVLMNEHSYSNAEIFPYAIRARGLGKLIGMPTPGYVIWTDSLRLVDGTSARMPQTGSYRLDGTNQENLGEAPDIQVPLTPQDWLAERDPQLDKAIEILAPQVESDTTAQIATE